MIRRTARRAAKRFVHGPAAPLIRHVLKTLLLEFHLVYGDPSRLRIAPTAKVSNAVFNTVSGHIEVQDHAFFGFNVAVLTGTHDYTRLDPGRQNAVTDPINDIVVEEGAWIATNVTILGPARIGAWSVVASGSVVRGDVAPKAVVAGVPAKVVRMLDESPSAAEGSPQA